MGSEAFSRLPADLPPGSRLYPQQVRAAVALTQRYVLQMDTGEGKTYALLPAAFALACEYGRVYIVCANEYLAWRDASRTRAYWNSIGIDPGLHDDDESSPEWSARVVYTTLPNLIFKALKDELRPGRPPYPVNYGSILLDDADAVLLDQGMQDFSVTQPLQGRAFDWSAAIGAASALDPEQHIVVDHAALTGSLTVEGEEFLLRSIPAEARSGTAYLLMRAAVEASFVATRVAQENVDYKVEGNRVLSIDRVTGEVQHRQTLPWVPPLEFSRGLPPRATTLTLHTLSPSVFLDEFQHVAGLSGTVKGDVTEYVLSYHVWTATIPPRRPRYDGLKQDVVYKTCTAALTALCDEVVNTVPLGRPILVGTQTIQDAEQAWRALRPILPPSTHLLLLTGKNERDIANTFEKAGEPGSVVVATQLAGRGVDIRLTDAARSVGGLSLFCLAHAVSRRHDLQFIGRAGRQGDPFTAQFICSLDDEFMKVFAGDYLQWIKKRWDDDVPAKHRLVTKAIRGGQARWQHGQFLLRRNRLFTRDADIQVRFSFKEWVEYLQASDSDAVEGFDSSFIEWVIGRFVTSAARLTPKDHRGLSLEESDELVRQIATSLELRAARRVLTAGDIEGLDADTCKAAIRDALRKGLTAAFAANREVRDRLGQAMDRHSELRRRYRRVRRDLTTSEALLPEIARRRQELVANGVHTDEVCPAPALLGEAAKVNFDPDDHPQISQPSDHALIKTNAPVEVDAPQTPTTLLMRLQSTLEEASPDTWPALEEQIFAIQQQLRSDAASIEAQLDAEPGLDPTPLGRTPRQTAHWTLELAWLGFLQERLRIKHRAATGGMSGLDYGRYVSDRLIQRWTQIEADLPRQMLCNLLKTDDPRQLDGVFHLHDYSSSYAADSGREEPLEWKPSGEIPEIPPEPDQSEPLIQQFVLTCHGELRRLRLGADPAVRRVLRDFLRAWPLRSLQSPRQVLTAINEAFVQDLERGIPRKRARLNRRCVQLFLVFLRQRNLIGKLPTTNEWLVSSTKRIVASAMDRSGALYVGFALLFVAAFGAISRVGDFAQQHPLDGLGRLVDHVMFAGWLAEGRITAPAMAALIVGWFCAFLIAPWAPSNTRGLAIDRLVVPLLQVAAAWWMTDWPASWSNVPSVLRALLVFTCIWSVAWATQKFVWTFAATSGVAFEAAWLAGTIPLVALPGLLTHGHQLDALVPTGAGLLLFFLLCAHLNYFEVRLVSGYSMQADLSDSEAVTHSHRIPAYTGAAAHVFAALIAWLACNLCALAGERLQAPVWSAYSVASLVGIVTYVAVLGVWVWQVNGKRFDLGLWRVKLNLSHQLFEGWTSESEIARRLDRLRWSAVMRELALQLGVAVAALVLLSTFGVMTNGLPVALVALGLVSLWAAMLNDFVTQVHKHFFSRIPFTHSVLDLAHLPEPREGKEERLERVKHFLQHRVALTFVIISVVFEIAHLVLKFLHS